MEEKRGGDILICSIYSFLFVCLTGGGSFLLIHMCSDHPQEWHLVAGMTLVGLPWCFWISTFAYTCLKHTCCFMNMIMHHPNPESTTFKATTTPNLEAITAYDGVSLDSPKLANRSSTDSNSPTDISPPDGDRCVKFSGVIVLGDHQDTHGHHHHHHQHNKESEFPIASSV